MIQDLKPIVGARIRAARKARAITQASLAEAIGRTEEAVSNMERGKSLPPLDVLQKIADHLDVTIVDLLQPPSMAGGSVGERATLELEIRLAVEAMPIKELRVAAKLISAMAEQ